MDYFSKCAVSICCVGTREPRGRQFCGVSLVGFWKVSNVAVPLGIALRAAAVEAAIWGGCMRWESVEINSRYSKHCGGVQRHLLYCYTHEGAGDFSEEAQSFGRVAGVNVCGRRSGRVRLVAFFVAL